MKIILHTRNHCSRGKGFGCQIINELPGFTGTTTPLAGIVAIIIVIEIIVNVIIIIVMINSIRILCENIEQSLVSWIDKVSLSLFESNPSDSFFSLSSSLVSCDIFCPFQHHWCSAIMKALTIPHSMTSSYVHSAYFQVKRLESSVVNIISMKRSLFSLYIQSWSLLHI